MKKSILQLVPVVLVTVAFVSATARAEDGSRHEFKPRWNKHFIKLFDSSLGNEDCDQAGQRLAACIQEKFEEYQKNPETLGDCTLGQDQCAYEDCVDSLEIAQMTCGFIQKDSAIAGTLTRWGQAQSKKSFPLKAVDIREDRECGAHYRKVKAGESAFLDRTLKMCSDMAPHSPGVLVRSAAGFTPLTDGYLCVHEGPFPKDVQCPAEFPLFLGVADVWYGCMNPDASEPANKSQIRCSDGFHLKYSFSSAYICVDDQDEDGDLVDAPENVCGKPSAEIAFAGFAENPNMMLHCCGTVAVIQ